MATFQQKLTSIQSLAGFEGYDYILFDGKSTKIKVALVEYWLSIGATDSVASSIKVFIVKNLGEVGETAKEASVVPKTVLYRLGN